MRDPVKKYIKPELFYEHYELSQHIADCAWEWDNLTNKDVCYAVPDDKLSLGFGDFVYKLFIEEPICTVDKQVVEDLCNQNSTADANLFRS